MDHVVIAREIDAMAQTGLRYATDCYDRERYERLREIAAEMRAELSGIPKEKFLDWNRFELGYATPKVDVRAFILRDGKMLLVREDQDEGRWTLPGGWADVEDTPSAAVIREVEEESGYDVRVDSLLAAYDREKQGHLPPHPYHIYKLFFKCTIVGGSPRANRESSECAFFGVDEIPELSESRTLAKQLQRFHCMCSNGGGIIADFD